VTRKCHMYVVTLRRDVQQKVVVRVEAFSQQEAIGVAESAANEDAWEVEGYIGSHPAKVDLASKVDAALKRTYKRLSKAWEQTMGRRTT
jgi:hypothetical protein